MSEPPPATYATGENALCYHGPLLYVAKVLTVQWPEDKHPMTGKEGWHYFVHYRGWKTAWDEWVTSERLLKDNETNRVIQRELEKNAPAGSRKTSSSGAAKDGGAGTSASANAKASARKETGPRGTKRGRDDAEENPNAKKEMKLDIPEQIKAKLLADWNTVTGKDVSGKLNEHFKLVTVPRAPTAQQLLKEFETYLSETKPAHLTNPVVMAPTIIDGILVYFDRSLANHLLYRNERVQHSAIREKYITGQNVVIGEEKPMSDIYGAEHLLRLLVTLPSMLAQSDLDPESTDLVREYLNELLSWMLQEHSRLFLPEYVDPEAAYLHIANTKT